MSVPGFPLSAVGTYSKRELSVGTYSPVHVPGFPLSECCIPLIFGHRAAGSPCGAKNRNRKMSESSSLGIVEFKINTMSI
jgi:hypothetical protein